MKYYRVRTNRHIYWYTDTGVIRYCSAGGYTETSDLNRGGERKLIPLTLNYILYMNLDNTSIIYKEYILKILKELVHEHKT